MREQRYAAFGMDIWSPLPLPLPLADGGASSPWRLDIVEAALPATLPLSRSLGDIRYGRFLNALYFDVPGVARYAIESGGRIAVESAPGAAGSAAGIYIAGLLLPILLSRRNILTLHGSAVVGKSGCLVFLGDRGAGKSTTAAAMASFGYAMLCDDVVPITADSLVMPGIPLPKLLPDAYKRLIGDPAAAAQCFDGVDKYHAPLPRSAISAPVRFLFVIEPCETPALSMELVKGARKLRILLSNVTSLEGLDDPESLFSRCFERLGPIPCYRLRRPASADCLDELARTIAELDRGVGAR